MRTAPRAPSGGGAPGGSTGGGLSGAAPTVSGVDEVRRGTLLAAAAYLLWGAFPLYFPLLLPSGALEVLAHRVLWSLAVVAVLVVALGRTAPVREVLRDRRRLTRLAVAAVLIGVNWGTYIYGVTSERVVEASLGYFVTPLVSVLLGVLVLGETLRGAQRWALGLAAAAVVVLTVENGRPPWLALVLAASFGTYGLLKKTAGVRAVEGLAVETAVLAPLAGAYLLVRAAHGSGPSRPPGPGTRCCSSPPGWSPSCRCSCSARRRSASRSSPSACCSTSRPPSSSCWRAAAARAAGPAPAARLRRWCGWRWPPSPTTSSAPPARPRAPDPGARLMLTREGAALAPFTTLRLGGPADRLVTAYDEGEVVDAVLASARVPLLVLGGGSNLVVGDEGFAGTVVRIASHGLAAVRDGDDVLLTAQAGEDWDALVEHAVAAGLAGLEAMSGIPGTVGATPVQNVGAYGADVSSVVERVRVLDRSSRRIVELTAKQCAFGYRASRFKADEDRWVVQAVTFRLRPDADGAPVRYAELARALGVELGGTAPLREVREAVLGLRRGKGMVVDARDPESRSAGSFFTNPVLDDAELAALVAALGDVEVPGHPEGAGRTKVSAAWLIERAGFTRGWGSGAAGLSAKHVLALVNRGGATTGELLEVARSVRDGVLERTGVRLVPEPVLVGCEL